MNTWNSFFAITIHVLFGIAHGEYEEEREFLLNLGRIARKDGQQTAGAPLSQKLTLDDIPRTCPVAHHGRSFQEAVLKLCHWELRDFLVEQLLVVKGDDSVTLQRMYAGCFSTFRNRFPSVSIPPREGYIYYEADEPTLLASLGVLVDAGYAKVDDVTPRLTEVDPTHLEAVFGSIFRICHTLESTANTGDETLRAHQRQACGFFRQLGIKCGVQSAIVAASAA